MESSFLCYSKWWKVTKWSVLAKELNLYSQPAVTYSLPLIGCGNICTKYLHSTIIRRKVNSQVYGYYWICVVKEMFKGENCKVPLQPQNPL